MTEEEAKTKWCPFARVIVGQADGSHIATQPPYNRFQRADDRTAVPPASYCIGSACMAWRWIKPIPRFKEGTMEVDPETLNLPPTHGYCGLAGKP